jgi:multicomponent Na+:H+ antiporter subunit B
MKMSIVVMKSSKLLAPFLVAYGAYLLAFSHLNPGGGFQGGVILAVSVILLITSHGYESVKDTFRIGLVKKIESYSALLILIMAIAGLFFGAFFLNFIKGGEPGTLFSGGTVVIYNILIGLKIGSAFVLLFYTLMRWTESD